VVRYLKSLGYRVLCIDKARYFGNKDGSYVNGIPEEAEDFTGDLPLAERAALLSHADFFIGLSSGLSWLAWAVGRPVILISGLTLPFNEFCTPYRLIDYHACSGCFNNSAFEFDRGDFAWCPRHKGTARQFECTRHIEAEWVNATIGRLMLDHNLQIANYSAKCTNGEKRDG
jgi:autotransporter strand-loop-strand O-heptosyltransferase